MTKCQVKLSSFYLPLAVTACTPAISLNYSETLSTVIFLPATSPFLIALYTPVLHETLLGPR